MLIKNYQKKLNHNITDDSDSEGLTKSYYTNPPVTNGLQFYGNLNSPRTSILSGLVAILGDSSGNGLDMAQATDSKRPAFTLRDPDFGFKPSMTFDGSSDILVSATIPLYSTPALTCAFVFRPTSIATTSVIFEGGAGTSNGSALAYQSNGKMTGLFQNPSSFFDQKSSPSLSNNTVYRIIITFDASNATNAVQSVFVNQVSNLTTVTSLATAGVFTDNSWYLGGRGAGSFLYAGKISLPLIYNRILTPNEIIDLDAWLLAMTS